MLSSSKRSPVAGGQEANWKPVASRAIGKLLDDHRVKQLGTKIKSVPQDLDMIKSQLETTIPTQQDFVNAVRDVFVRVLQSQVDGQRDSLANRRLAFASLDTFSPFATELVTAGSGMDFKNRGLCRSAVDDLTTALASGEYTLGIQLLHPPSSSAKEEEGNTAWLGSIVRDLELDVFKTPEEFAASVRNMLTQVWHQLGEDDAVKLQVQKLNDQVLNKSRLDRVIKPKSLEFVPRGVAQTTPVASPAPTATAEQQEDKPIEQQQEDKPVEQQQEDKPVEQQQEEGKPAEQAAAVASPPPSPPPETTGVQEEKQPVVASEEAAAEEAEEEEGNDEEDSEEPAPKKKEKAKKHKDSFTKETRQACLDTLKLLRKEKCSEQFREPVPWKKYGLDDYPKVIAEPMDLGTLKSLVDRKTVTTISEFTRLGKLIFENCIKYNHKDIPFEVNLRKEANQCSKLFDKFLAQNLDAIKPPAAAAPEKKSKKQHPQPETATLPPPAKKKKSTNTVDEGDGEDFQFDPELKMNKELEQQFKDAIRTLSQFSHAGWFLDAVDLKAFPTYKQFCPKPMDLSIVTKRLDSGKHYKLVKDLVKDVELIWRNCRAFNPEETKEFPILSDCRKCELMFQSQVKEIVTKYLKKQEVIKASSLKLAAQKPAAAAAATPQFLPPITEASCRDANTGQFKAPPKAEFSLNPTEELIRSSLTTLSSTEQAKKYFGIPVLQMYDAQFGEAYRERISKPMDLQTCFIKLSKHEYSDETRGPQLANEDVQLIFTNAKTFNVGDVDMLQVVEHCAEFWLNIFTENFGTAEEKQALADKRNAVVLPSEAQKKRIAPVLKKLTTKELLKGDAKEFMHPVYSDSFTLPDYHDVVKEPRDLSLISRNVENEVYATYGDFVRDVRLVFSNCLLYNKAELKENASYRASATRMSTLFETEWNKLTVLLYEYILRKQAEERHRRLVEGDAYVEEVKKPRKSLQSEAKSVATHHHRTYHHMGDMSDEDDAKDEDDEEEVKFRKRKSMKQDGQQQPPKKKMREKSLGGGTSRPTSAALPTSELDYGATAAAQAAVASAMMETSQQQGKTSSNSAAGNESSSQLGQFELETEIQSQARREYFRQHRMEQKKRRALVRGVMRETYAEMVKNMREGALARAEKQQHEEQPEAASAAKAGPEVMDNEQQEGGIEPPSQFPVAVKAAVTPQRQRRRPVASVFSTTSEDGDGKDTILPADKKQQQQHSSNLGPIDTFSSPQLLKFPVHLPAHNATTRSVLFSKRFGTLTLWTLLVLFDDDGNNNNPVSLIELEISMPKRMDFVQNVFSGSEADVSSAMAHSAYNAEFELHHDRFFASQALLAQSPRELLRLYLVTRSEFKVTTSGAAVQIEN